MLSSAKCRGIVIFWNGRYGFIEEETGGSIFFRQKNILDHDLKNRINYFYTVSYTIELSTEAKHIGKKVANNVELIKAFDIWKEEKAILENKKLYVGRLIEWYHQKAYGFIQSPQIEAQIKLFRTRLITRNHFLKTGDLLVFYPVKSFKNFAEKFAYFAYYIDFEEDPVFLSQQMKDSGQLILRKYIERVLKTKKIDGRSPDDQFDVKLALIDFEKDDSYFTIEALIKEFQKNNYFPTYSTLEKFCPEKFLIQLWENGVLNSYDQNLLFRYFVNSPADNKRNITLRLNDDERERILIQYFNYLKSSGKLERASNDLKTLLDIAFRNNQTKNEKVYRTIREYIANRLKPEDLVDLWLNGYIDGLQENYLIKNFDLNNENILNKLGSNKDDKYRSILLKLYHDYFFNFRSIDFPEDYHNLIIRLLIFQDNFNSEYEQVIKAIRTKLDSCQIFILWVFDVEIDFDVFEFFKNEYNSIDVYPKIKYFLRSQKEYENIELSSMFPNIDLSNEAILSFVEKQPWNQLINPTEVIFENSYAHNFLADLEKFAKEFKNENFDINLIAERIFDTIPKYTVWHIRLWLNGYIDNVKYNYTGFRDNFKELNKYEQQIFKKRGDYYGQLTEVDKVELQEVKPCKNFFLKSPTKVIYYALIENIYFGNGSFKLKTQNNQYTLPCNFEFSSKGLNRIPESDPLNEIEIKITVEINSGKLVVISHDGLEKITTRIHTGSIEKALGGIEEKYSNSYQINKAYVEDWKLRKSIIDWLHDIHEPDFEIIYLNEPKAKFGRLDKFTKNIEYEKTCLFTIKTDDGYAIVWENIDLTDDRATYIFKTSEKDYSNQIAEIKYGILNLAQFRSTLISKTGRIEVNIFQRKYGFVASIRKQRGKIGSLINYQSKLYSFIQFLIPIKPTIKELEALKKHSVFTTHHPSPRSNRGNIIKIHEDEIDTTSDSPDGKDTGSFQISKNPTLKEENQREKLLIKLKEFNQILSETLNIE